jgi:hypothetical protein
MRVTVRAIIVGACLGLVVLAGACGSKSAVTTSTTPAPAKTLTAKQQAIAYFKQLKPIARAEERAGKKLEETPLSSYRNGFSAQARINNFALPVVKHMRTRLKAITPPPLFRVAHARLERECTILVNAFYDLQEAIEQAVFTGTVPPGFDAKFERYSHRLEKLDRQCDAAMRAAAKRSGVKVPKVLLMDQ